MNVEHLRGSARELHGREWPEVDEMTVWVFEVDRPALVLGSTQDEPLVDRDRLAASGIDLARRRSGGGAVLLVPDAHVWIDVLLPRHDPRWVDDIGRSFAWLGQAWAGALGAFGLAAEVHAGALVCGRFGKQVCFAGVGPGEVTVDGAKVVGLSQRRTRAGARFQAVVHRRWDPEPYAAIAGVEPGELPPVVALDVSAPALEAALLALL